MNSLKENTQFGITDKSIIGALVEMTTKRFDWSRSINVRVILRTKLIIKLKTMGTDCKDKNDGYGCERVFLCLDIAYIVRCSPKTNSF